MVAGPLAVVLCLTRILYAVQTSDVQIRGYAEVLVNSLHSRSSAVTCDRESSVDR